MAESRELAQASVVPPAGAPGSGTGTGATTTVVVEPTQVRRPWKATIRTIFQLALALATLLPLVAAGAYGEGEDVPYAVAQVLVFAGAFTRVMALPAVEAFLQQWFPWLAAAPPAADELAGGRRRVDRGATSTRTIAWVALGIAVVVLLIILF